ncbi:hypothetical protein CCACVL1_14131 [Corchorus capsularis]|uniref:Uncharacterized protein n=1 Tax=Corchorus capsularis TaxID=210143 RepID=A0A1R3I868_COCAP|nr:hypothetical protein CCACVL1_14131 [Corchorus capsularis]
MDMKIVSFTHNTRSPIPHTRETLTFTRSSLPLPRAHSTLAGNCPILGPSPPLLLFSLLPSIAVLPRRSYPPVAGNFDLFA